MFPTRQFGECRAACESHPSCTFFTVTPVVCVLKGDEVSIKKRPGAVSGMTKAACGEEPKRNNTGWSICSDNWVA